MGAVVDTFLVADMWYCGNVITLFVDMVNTLFGSFLYDAICLTVGGLLYWSQIFCFFGLRYNQVVDIALLCN